MMHLVMFDVDGTLVDSAGFDDACYVAAAREVLGFDIPAHWDEYTQATDAAILDEILDRYGVEGDRELIHSEFKQTFISKITEHLEANPGEIREIKGAARFINYLTSRDNVKVAIATGGWEESAKLKLRAAGIDIAGCGFASCSDHHLRTGIMELAETRMGYESPFDSKTYFGDAAWDREASKVLSFNFILVGTQIDHEMRISDYRDIDRLAFMLSL